jgi:hypothetical protein
VATVESAKNVAEWAPLVCAVHCVATPLVALAAPVAAGAERYEPLIMLVAGIVVVATLQASVRAHRRLPPIIPVLAGGLLWVLSLVGNAGPVPEWLLGGTGGVLIFAGVRWSARLRAEALAGCCRCPACEAEIAPE